MFHNADHFDFFDPGMDFYCGRDLYVSAAIEAHVLALFTRNRVLEATSSFIDHCDLNARF